VTELSLEAAARREAARVQGKFGEQTHSAPESALEAAGTAAEREFSAVVSRAQTNDPRVREQLRAKASVVLASILEDSGAKHIALAEDDADEFSVYVESVDGAPGSLRRHLEDRVTTVVMACATDWNEVGEIPGVETHEDGTWTFEVAEARKAQREEATQFGSLALARFADKIGEDTWRDYFNAGVAKYLAEHKDAVELPDDERTRIAGEFLLAYGVATNAVQVQRWLNAAYAGGRTGSTTVRLVGGEPEQVIPSETMADTVAEVLGDDADLQAELLDSSTDAFDLRDLVAEAHYRGLVDRDLVGAQ
jgi:hypothetical protein